MLSSIGRAALRRVAGATSTNRTAQGIWHVQRPHVVEGEIYHSFTSNICLFSPRNYATATKVATKPTVKTTKTKTTTTKVKTPAKKDSKTPVKKPAVKKEKKVVAKKKAKPKPKKIVKKVLTDDQKKLKQLRELRAVALTTPKALPDSPFQLVQRELTVKGTKVSTTSPIVAAKYKSLSSAELEVNGT